MARYDIARACGHTERIDISGPQRERESRAQWEATRLCRPCFLAQQEADRRAAAEQAATQAAAQGLPPLAGSAKQVAWATTIRVEMLDLARAAIAEFAGEMHAEGRARVARGLAALEHTTEAKWWIDHRPAPAAWSSPQADRLFILKLLAIAGGPPPARKLAEN